jgi:hypothetical protein
MRMKTILSAMLALIVAPAIVLGANLALQTGPVDTANLRGIINQLIQSINSGVTGNITMDDLTAGVVIKCTGTDGTSAEADITVNSFMIDALR